MSRWRRSRPGAWLAATALAGGLVAAVPVLDSEAGVRDFSAGFEASDPRPSPGEGLEPGAGPAHSGIGALRYSGPSGTAPVFDVDLAVTAETVLEYWVRPDLAGAGAAVDLEFTDGTLLSGTGATDRNGVRLHPADQSAALRPGRWNLVRTAVGERAAGKTVSRILVGHLAGTGHLDDLAVQAGGAPARPSELVDTRRGSNSDRSYSRGNTFPAAAVPNGFNFWTPVTQGNSGSWMYTYAAKTVQGFAVSHQASPWVGDYAQLQVMPMTGGAKTSPRARRSVFDHADEVARADYYKTELGTYGITAEMAPSDHAGVMRFTYPAAADSVLLFDTVDWASGAIEVDAPARTITGRVDHGGQILYFSATVDKAIEASGTGTGPGTSAWVRFATGAGERVVLRLATSFISVDQATANLGLEVGGRTFDRVRAEAAARWDEVLGRIRIEGAPRDRLVVFYSNLYRAYLYPNERSEPVEGRSRYLSPYDGTVHDGRMYVNNGFWDTARAVWPLYTLLTPDRSGEMLGGFVNAAAEGGWTPRWSGPGYRDLMVGTHQDTALADAYLKGVRGFDPEAAYAAMVKNATVASGSGDKGRKGLEVSAFKRYVPADLLPESASWTLEDAANDFAVAQMAHALGHEEDAAYFRDRSLSYVNLFSSSDGFFRGRLSSGARPAPGAAFDPAAWTSEFTEGNAWHYALAAPQDPQGLAALYGGRSGLAAKLDALFAADRDHRPGTSGKVTPEMRGASDLGLGQYAHSNEPVHHMIYMYDYAGQPAKAQDLVRTVLTTLYDAGEGTGNGYPGDEDNGQMSAWYVFSALGFYPARPGGTEYAIGAPLHPKAVLTLENGRSFTVEARGVSDTNRYIQSARLNGAPYSRTFLTHADITAGGRLTFTMGPNPSAWGTNPDDAPPSITGEDDVPSPLADVTGAGTLTATGQNAPSQGVGALTDDTSRTQWMAFLDTATVETRLPAPARVEQYTLTSAADQPATDPSSWRLQASDDGTTWTTLDSRTSTTFPHRLQTRPFTIDHPAPYTHYRLQITGNNGAPQTQLAEWELLARSGGGPVGDEQPGR
ncbi:GH92 family glycosyl hydrolase [Actinocorallia longicatena]|uniref:F5/8 type C domain-containing protein n=1 Tax=Actinocorallia longicatena TaxID=111803 RepID=A0ABP6QLN2_9ACTN